MAAIAAATTGETPEPTDDVSGVELPPLALLLTIVEVPLSVLSF